MRIPEIIMINDDPSILICLRPCTGPGRIPKAEKEARRRSSNKMRAAVGHQLRQGTTTMCLA